jgi:Acetyltransferase (GNAT) domain
MTRVYSINWLEPEDAADVARLEAQIHTSDHRAGQQIIAAQLLETTAQGRNLSLGLYHGKRLVGFALAFLAHNRQEVASFFDAPVPAALNAEERVVYVADVAVLARHRRKSSSLLLCLARVVRQREDLRALGVDAFSTEKYLAFWVARAQSLRRLGFELVGWFPFHDTKLQTTMYWLSMRRISRADQEPTQPRSLRLLRRYASRGSHLVIGEVDPAEDWRVLTAQWAAKLNGSINSSLAHHLCYLRSWWSGPGALGNLLILIAAREGVIAAMAPMQIEETRWLGRPLRRLTFMDSVPELTGVSLLARPQDIAAISALAEHITTERGDWDSIALMDQRSDDPFVRVLEACLRAANLPVSVRPGLSTLSLSIAGSWNAYLAARPAVFIKRLAAAETGICAMAQLRFETCDASSGAVHALERFVALEAKSPSQRRDAVSASSANVTFFRTLATRYAAELGLQFAFLVAGRNDIAALLGFTLDRHFYPIHVTWDDTFSQHDPGLVVTARTLQRMFDANECDSVILGSPAVPARAHWAAQSSPTVSLYGSRDTARGWLLHATYAVGKPLLKRLIGRGPALP